MSSVLREHATIPQVDVLVSDHIPDSEDEAQLDADGLDVELAEDPSLAGIPPAVLAQIGCYDTDCAGGCG